MFRISGRSVVCVHTRLSVQFLVSLVGLFAAYICFYALDAVSAVCVFDFADLWLFIIEGVGVVCGVRRVVAG